MTAAGSVKQLYSSIRNLDPDKLARQILSDYRFLYIHVKTHRETPGAWSGGTVEVGKCQ